MSFYDFVSLRSLALYVSLSLIQCLCPSPELSLLSPAESVALGSYLCPRQCVRISDCLQVLVFSVSMSLFILISASLCLVSLSSSLKLPPSPMLGVHIPVCLFCSNHLFDLLLSRSEIFLSIPCPGPARHLCLSSSRSPICHSPCLLHLALFLGLFPQPHGCRILCL